MAGLGPQVVVLITTQQGAEIKAEVERWLPTNAILEAGVPGLAPTEGRTLIQGVIGRSLDATELVLTQEIGELVGWHPEALRLAAIEGREIGWQGMLGELQAGRMPWIEIRRLVIKQWARLHPSEQDWLAALIKRETLDTGFTADEVGQCWEVVATIVGRRIWSLECYGLVARETIAGPDSPRWRVGPAAHKVLTEIVQQHEKKRNDRQ